MNTSQFLQAENVLKDLEHIRNEIRTAWNQWDSHIEAGQQPVPIQDLDFWAGMIKRDISELSRIIQESHKAGASASAKEVM